MHGVKCCFCRLAVFAPSLAAIHTGEESRRWFVDGPELNEAILRSIVITLWTPARGRWKSKTRLVVARHGSLRGVGGCNASEYALVRVVHCLRLYLSLLVVIKGGSEKVEVTDKRPETTLTLGNGSNGNRRGFGTARRDDLPDGRADLVPFGVDVDD